SKTWLVPLPRDVGVIVVAAGRGMRFGGEVPKQFQLLAGVPVLLHALHPFLAHADVANVIVVVPDDIVAEPPEWLREVRGDRLLLVAGGRERSDSVRAGLAALPPECSVVLVHDGARPFPSRAIIDLGIDAVRRGHSAVPALPIRDTVKRADDFGRVLSTVDRKGLWRAQTPQAFPRRTIDRAHAAIAIGEPASDDSVLVERLGEHVELFPGSARNLKITSVQDLVLAAWYAEQSP
ncbi:MAG: 2-C-methyl-D-erythritol 4-phosphate cytidylyltransferase, partial [Gemmatimonadales bacterium]